jgi:hypothetical protein
VFVQPAYEVGLNRKGEGQIALESRYLVGCQSTTQCTVTRAPTPAIARTHNDLAAMYDRMLRDWERAREFELVSELAD